jgi:hypothetical protein
MRKMEWALGKEEKKNPGGKRIATPLLLLLLLFFIPFAAFAAFATPSNCF